MQVKLGAFLTLGHYGGMHVADVRIVRRHGECFLRRLSSSSIRTLLVVYPREVRPETGFIRKERDGPFDGRFRFAWAFLGGPVAREMEERFDLFGVLLEGNLQMKLGVVLVLHGEGSHAGKLVQL